MGFGEPLFTGVKIDYENFLRKNKEENFLIEPSVCIPDYYIAGGECPENSESLSECSLRNYEKEGGSCLRGLSDVFIHCSLGNTTPKFGTWTEWHQADGGVCHSCYNQGLKIKIISFTIIGEGF